MNEKQYVIKIKQELLECTSAFSKETNFLGAEVVKSISNIPKQLDIKQIKEECKLTGIKIKVINKTTKTIKEPSIIFSLT